MLPIAAHYARQAVERAHRAEPPLAPRQPSAARTTVAAVLRRAADRVEGARTRVPAGCRS